MATANNVSATELSLGANEWRRHWAVLFPCIGGITLSSFHAYSLGVMMAPLQHEFGWSRAQISTGPLFASFLSPLLVPFVGMAVDRFGPRRIALFGVVFFCAALAFLSRVTANIHSWWLHWTLLAFAAMFILPLTWITAINGFYSVNRGKALAIALCGTGVSAAIAPVLTNALIDAQGWRQAYVSLALLCFVPIAPLVYFLFHGPTDVRRKRTPQALHVTLPGLTMREGVRSQAFLQLVSGIFIFSLAGCVLTTNAVPVLTSQGFGRTAAAEIAGLIGIGAIVGRLCGGALLDRYDAKKVAAVCVLAPVVGVADFLLLPGVGWSAVIATLVIGLSAGAEIDACAYLAARHFGMRSFASLFGVINGLLALANGVGPVISNHVYDLTRSYDPVLWAMIPICLVAAILLLMLGDYPEFGADMPMAMTSS
jgi:MFS family permease